MPKCPARSSGRTVKNGHIHTGKQRFKCHDCGRQFVENPDKKMLDTATRELIDRLLLERISLAAIARAVRVSEQWLQALVNRKYAAVPRVIQVSRKKSKITIQCDELGSFVDNKGNKQWVRLALDAETREIVGVYIGARDEAAARELWTSLPPVYRQRALVNLENPELRIKAKSIRFTDHSREKAIIGF